MTATVGAQIRAAREAKGWTQLDLAKACGWADKDSGGQGRISHYEKGRREPGVEEIRIIADALGVSMEQLAVRNEAERQPEEPPAIKTILPNEAFRLLQERPNAILIDVRSSMEFLFVGHPTGAINIPWIDQPNWKINTHFVTQVRQAVLGGAHGAAPVLLICRSGVRSLEAGDALIEEGFKDVYNVGEGFEGPLDEKHHRSSVGGWRFHGLPWEQS